MKQCVKKKLDKRVKQLERELAKKEKLLGYFRETVLSMIGELK